MNQLSVNYSGNRVKSDADLDVTPFLSFMVVLIPVLLLLVRFSTIDAYDISTATLNEQDSSIASPVSYDFLKLSLIVKNDKYYLKNDKVDLLDGTLTSVVSLQKISKYINNINVNIDLDLIVEPGLKYMEVVNVLDSLNKAKGKINSLSISVG
ncbi:hypothetical protein [Vibrio parahaemolyticus]|uniref:hypothetical protein n=1 Tax=Vibrio parahaemolyticus TaxID=670 RepID=UPI00111DA864|nr:hypothetical protein [Vibrio parahaemolyticus]TOG86224.1 hypothetical protein CGI92_24985 [Vibrio parahaemolyticus]